MEPQTPEKGASTPQATPLDQTSLNIASTDSHIHDEDEDDYPDGGWQAWSVVLGAWCAMMPSMGLLNTLAQLRVLPVLLRRAGRAGF
ncbi:hypothetical protein NLG97_g7500 [Lecanicillium saksenae]|uniref:Uncharacterized protein n=1 Tax=Lecanicillium saksenae TaxID=468837 RepID=A0ACC1QN73_9HYPO|nr:hypothetical protein NLG97_g7500 [Lecanicillium saksenae]